MPELIYKICGAIEWERAAEAGTYLGSKDDLRDGFIHFSHAEQLAVTLKKYFSGRADVVLIAVETAGLGEALRHEASRGGALFPHLHAPLPTSSARWVRPLPLVDGVHRLPAL